MIFDRYGYVLIPALSGDIEADARAFLLANGRPRTCAHVFAVADQSEALARRCNLDAAKCRAAAALHDISAPLRPADMLDYAVRSGFPLCEAERAHPFLLHQRLSRVIAEEVFAVRDEEILSPIACHTTLRPEASPGDMLLFLADKLAWDQEGEPPYLASVLEALERSLPRACLAYMRYMEQSGRLLCPHADWTAARAWLDGLA